jgi:hypothetical protein
MDKKELIIHYIAPLLHALDGFITNVECDEHTVYIEWITGYVKKVSIDGQDGNALARKILRAVA